MNLKTYFDNATSTLTYVVWDPATLDAVIIDPVLNYDPVGSVTQTDSAMMLLNFVRETDLNVHFVLETHAHADHLSSAQLLRRHLDAQIAIGEHIVAVQETFKAALSLNADFATDGSQFDKLLKDQEVLMAGSLPITVLHTPGHTPACISFKIDDAVFTGDALFIEDFGTGRCDFPKGSAKDLYDSVQNKLYTLPDETRVFVGHDYQPGDRDLRYETTIGASKSANIQLQANTSCEEFVEFRNARDALLKAPKLLFQSVQVNIDAGRLPKEEANGGRYFRLPLNLFAPTDGVGEMVISKSVQSLSEIRTLEDTYVIAHPTDLHPNGGVAFSHGIAIAAKGKGKLISLVLTDEQVSLPPISSIVSRWDIEPSDVDHSVVKHECCQDLIDTVLDGIRKLGPDLLVVGTHRGRGVVHWLSGSPAVSLARNTDVPTLLLPIGERGLIAREDGNIRLENVLIPVETQEAADTAFDALSKFMDGAGIENATVHLLGAEGKCDLERIRLPRDKEWQFEKHCRVEKLEKAVDALADEVNANLIVMATNGQDSFHDFLWGTHTERVLAHANRPVMSVQMKNGN